MTNIRILGHAALLMFFRVGDGLAGEVTTECPPTKPGQPEVALKYGEPWPEGIPVAGGADEYVEKDGLVYSTTDYVPVRPILNSIIMCQYMDGSRIQVPIPGALLRCGDTFREISQTPPIKIEWLRVWCVSDVK